jgi:zinc protease
MLSLLAALLLLIPTTTAAQLKPGQAEAWPWQNSDLPLNPRVHVGALPNGLRYAWIANSEPKQRCYVRLHVDAGSLAEQDSEQGLAHFLEHMAFNGSEHFEAGTLVEWFQKHGMGFGGDTNASTDFSETIFMLDLPTADAGTLREGLTFLHDVAGGLALSADEVQAEKGVIDGEERERDSVDFRAGIADLKDFLEGTRVAARIPIGLKPVRDAFTSETVRAFWHRWYRPENMTLVIAGDLGELDPAAMITEMFSDLKLPEGPPEAEPALGTPPAKDDAFVHYASEIPTVQLSAVRWKPWLEERQTKAQVTKDLPLQYARQMVNLRLRELARKPDAVFLRAALGDASTLRVTDGEDLSVTCKPEHWQAALAVGEQELRRALQHGFRKPELEELRKDALHDLDEAVNREPTRNSQSYAAELLAACEDPIVPTTAAVDRDVLKPAIEALTVEACRDALRKAWGEGHLRLSAVGGLDLGADGASKLTAAWAESGKVEVAAPPELAEQSFAYASDAKIEGVEMRRLAPVEDLGLTQLVFANGVKLNVKPTDFRERQVMVQARFGHGQAGIKPGEAPLATMVQQVFDAGGLGKHSQDDLRRLLAGKQAGVHFGISEDSFTLGGTTTPDDLLLELELACAYLSDPGWREEALDQARRNLPPLFASLEHQVSGPLQTMFLGKLHGGDARFGLPPLEQLQAVTIPQLRAWLDPVLHSAPIELTVVGDVELEAVINAAARTFGKLPKRGPDQDVKPLLAVHTASGLHEAAKVPTEVPQALVTVWTPTTDGQLASTRRQLSMLSQIVNDRLRVVVREKLGDSYSPGAQSNASRAFPGVGFLIMNAASEPGRTQDVLEACLGVTQSLATEGVTAEELDRLRAPILAQLRDQQRNNQFWMSVLADSQTRPAALDDARKLEADYQAMTPELLTELARKYLPKERANWLVVKPVAAAPAPADPAGG